MIEFESFKPLIWILNQNGKSIEKAMMYSSIVAFYSVFIVLIFTYCPFLFFYFYITQIITFALLLC